MKSAVWRRTRRRGLFSCFLVSYRLFSALNRMKNLSARLVFFFEQTDRFRIFVCTIMMSKGYSYPLAEPPAPPWGPEGFCTLTFLPR